MSSLLPLLLACAGRTPSPEPVPEPHRSQGGEAELVVEGPVETRVSHAPADLVLFYGGEQAGNLGTCGCPTRPRGGLARTASYLAASDPGLLLLGGHWLEDPNGLDALPSPAIVQADAAMVEGLELLGVDAANLSYQDLAALAVLDTVPEWALSANIEGPGIQPWRILEQGGVKVGVTGITRVGASLSPTPHHRIRDPYEPGLAALRELAPQVDVLVLLAYDCGAVARDLALAVPELDVVVDTALHQGFYAPERIGEALWVRSHFQTLRLGELRLALHEGEVELVIDRKIDLDDQLPEDPRLSALEREAEAPLP